MSDKPKLAEVKTIRTHTLRDVPAVLRSIAQQIEYGIYGDVHQATIVILGDKLEVFGAGECDSTDAHYLLSCGVQVLQGPCVGKGRN